jgi:hypothetical protein
MDKNSVANWRERAKWISEASFDCKEALRLAHEIRERAEVSSISYRAIQAIHILENIKRAPKPSERQIADAKTALNSLRRTLKALKLQ